MNFFVYSNYSDFFPFLFLLILFIIILHFLLLLLLLLHYLPSLPPLQVLQFSPVTQTNAWPPPPPGSLLPCIHHNPKLSPMLTDAYTRRIPWRGRKGDTALLHNKTEPNTRFPFQRAEVFSRTFFVIIQLEEETQQQETLHAAAPHITDSH